MQPLIRYRQSAFWTPEVRQKLVELWNGSEKSVAEIADALGVSRGSIVGKISRLRKEGIELKERAVGKRPDGTPARPRPPATYKHHTPRRGGCGVVGAVLTTLNTPSSDHYVSIEGLERHHCREVMVVGPKALYCGAQKQEKSSFCPFHHAKNWTEPMKRLR